MLTDKCTCNARQSTVTPLARGCRDNEMGGYLLLFPPWLSLWSCIRLMQREMGTLNILFCAPPLTLSHTFFLSFFLPPFLSLTLSYTTQCTEILSVGPWTINWPKQAVVALSLTLRLNVKWLFHTLFLIWLVTAVNNTPHGQAVSNLAPGGPS